MGIPFVNKLKAVWYELGQAGLHSFTSFGSGFNRHRSKRELLHEYKNIAYACINAIAEDVGQYEPIFKKGNPKKPNELKQIDHPFLEVLKNPNPSTSQFEFFETSAILFELNGEIFWHVGKGENTNKPRELLNLWADRMEVAIDELTGEVAGYTYLKSDGTRMPLDVDEVIHIKSFNPYNPYRGMGTVEASLVYLHTEDNISLFPLNFIKNQATPSGILTLKGNIKSEAFKNVKKEWKEQQSGVANVGKTLFLREMDAKFEKIGLSLADLDLGNLEPISTQKIHKMFRVPEAILGKTDSTGLGRANVETIEYIFAKRTIEPKLVRFDDAIKRAVKTLYQDDVIVTHVSQVPEDQESLRNNLIAGTDKWLTRNEARAMAGLNPIEGGDELYVEFNKVPMLETTNTNTGKIILKTLKKKDVNDEGETENRYFRKLTRLELSTDRSYRKGFKTLLEDQKDKVIEIVQNAHTKSIVDTANAITFSLTFTDEEIELNLLASLLDAIEKAGELGIDFLGLPDEEFVLQQSTRDAVFGSTERLMKSFNKETAEKIQKQLAAGLADGEDVKKLQKRVESIYAEAEGFRAKRIAQTEAHNAVNEGTAESFRQVGYYKMRWVANPTACEYCKAMDGTITEIGTSFIPQGASVQGVDGGEYVADYQDVKYANLHPNCQCYLLPEQQ